MVKGESLPPQNETFGASAPPPLPTISPSMRQRLQQLFQRASQMAEKSDFDYAHDLFSECVAADPGNLIYVQAMLDNLQRKYKNNRKGGRGLSFGGGRKNFNRAVADEEWGTVYREGFALLKSNPWDVPTLRALARASAIHRHNEVELRYLKNALDANPKDPEVNRHCAHSLARMGQYEMAIACWHRIAEAKKGGDEPQKMISELTLAKTMGVPPSIAVTGEFSPRSPVPTPPPSPSPTSTPSSETDAPEDEGPLERTTSSEPAKVANHPTQDESPRREIKLNRRQVLERTVRESPREMGPYLELATIHREANRFRDAEKILEAALQAVGPSLELQSAYEDAQIHSAKAKVMIAVQRAHRDKTEESKQLVRDLQAELNRLELDVYGQRCQRFPENRKFRLQLGLRLRQANNTREAIKAFDEARHDPTLAVESVIEMGECWQMLKQYQKAFQCYQWGVQHSTELDGDHRKRALYRGAILAEALKQPDLAREWLTALHVLDPHYKDASSRLDKLA